MTVDANLLELLFSGANLFVLPFWTLMVLVPALLNKSMNLYWDRHLPKLEVVK